MTEQEKRNRETVEMMTSCTFVLGDTKMITVDEDDVVEHNKHTKGIEWRDLTS